MNEWLRKVKKSGRGLVWSLLHRLSLQTWVLCQHTTCSSTAAQFCSVIRARVDAYVHCLYSARQCLGSFWHSLSENRLLCLNLIFSDTLLNALPKPRLKVCGANSSFILLARVWATFWYAGCTVSWFYLGDIASDYWWWPNWYAYSILLLLSNNYSKIIYMYSCWVVLTQLDSETSQFVLYSEVPLYWYSLQVM